MLTQAATPWTPTTRAPAWLMSLVLHLALVLLLAILVRTPTQGAGLSDEPSRQASLVMVRQHGEQREYFDQQQHEAASAAAAGQPTDAALPDVSDAALDSVLDLPDTQPGTASADALSELLAGPNLAAGGGRVRLPSGQNIQSMIDEEMQQRGRGSGPEGPYATMSLFGGAPSQGHRFVFVVDRSKSMGSSGLGGMRAVEQELEAALKLLDVNHRFNIMAYNHSTVAFSGRSLAPATKENIDGAEQFFAQVAAFGSTNHGRAIHSALALRPDVIYLFTDGGDPFLTPNQLNEIASIAKNQGATIHCVQFGLGPMQKDDSFLIRLAAMTHGGYQYVDMGSRK